MDPQQVFKKIKLIGCLMYLNVFKEIYIPGGKFRVALIYT